MKICVGYVELKQEWKFIRSAREEVPTIYQADKVSQNSILGIRQQRRIRTSEPPSIAEMKPTSLLGRELENTPTKADQRGRLEAEERNYQTVCETVHSVGCDGVKSRQDVATWRWTTFYETPSSFCRQFSST